MSRQCSGCESREDCRKDDFPSLKKEFIGKLCSGGNGLSNSLDAKSVVLYSCALGDYLASVELKASQVRRFLDAFSAKNISLHLPGSNLDAKDEALLLQPRLAYAAAKQRKKVGPLFEILKPAMQRVRGPDDFDRLTRFLESVVAYHKYHDGRD